MTDGITDIFNKFAGREIRMVESQYDFTFPPDKNGRPGKTFKLDESYPDQNDPTLREMEKAAKEKGLRLRVWFPGMMGTMDYDLGRVNAHVVKGMDGKYRVGSKFNLG